MKKRSQLILLILLIILFFAVNYNFIDRTIGKFLDESQFGVVERIVDGDTIIVNNNSVRLLGINTPERGEKYYKEAKDFLEMVLLNKTVRLEFGKEKVDKYGRTLAYIFVNEKSVNKEIVDEGYANFYFPDGKDRYYDIYIKAWNHCLTNNKYLCEKSEDECADCIELKELDVDAQTLVLYNSCNLSCNLTNWTIKDEGRKKFVFKNFILEKGKEVKIIVDDRMDSDNTLFWRKKDYVWTSSGDTLFLRDEEGKLVLWESY